MVKVEIYTTPLCGFCLKAKRLLDSKNVTYIEVDLYQQPERRDEMVHRSGGRRTVPQIFIGETYIGGCDDLYTLETAGALDPLLTGIL
ncbi:MAG: glutaredoxin 3 [Alphaproteobacteria bacterium]